ncbi:MAG: hypothetical protein GF330_03620, partial [Candidatus Eisenbacteria bacterium]|nr:hypothetical protein [Candidatus Eisenbacteria bacterium]
MLHHAHRVLGVGLLVSLCLTTGIVALTGPARALPPQEPSGRLVVLDWGQPDFGVLVPVRKEAELLAHNRDLALLRLPLDLTLPAELAGRVTRFDPLPTGGELSLWQVGAPAQARFAAPARVLHR